MIYAIALTLIGIMVLCVLALREDAKQKRVNRQLAVILPATPSNEPQDRSVRLQQRQPSWDRFLRVLLNYKRDAPRLWPTKRVILFGCAAGFASLVAGRLMMPLWLVPFDAILTSLFVMRALFGWQQRSYANKLLRQLPDTMELITSAVKAGLPVAESFRAVAREMPIPTSEQFALVVDEMGLGRPVEEGLRSVYRRTQVEEYAIFSVTLAVQSRAGGRLAETLQTLADTIRGRVALAGRANALAAEAKLSARVLICIPFVAGLALYLERPESLDPLFHDHVGRMLFVFGLISLFLGIITMRRMIRKGTTV